MRKYGLDLSSLNLSCVESFDEAFDNHVYGSTLKVIVGDEETKQKLENSKYKEALNVVLKD